MDYNILYNSATPIWLEGYTDADWAYYKADRRTTWGFVFLPRQRGHILEQQKAQVTFALSSTETEYWGTTVATCEVIWLKRILKYLGVPITDPILLYYDSMSNIDLAQNPMFHARTKHIEGHYHFIQECVLAGHVDQQHINKNM